MLELTKLIERFEANKLSWSIHKTRFTLAGDKTKFGRYEYHIFANEIETAIPHIVLASETRLTDAVASALQQLVRYEEEVAAFRRRDEGEG